MEEAKEKLIEYKCPCCGGAIEYNSTAGKLKCPYCNNEFDVDTLESMSEELKDDINWDSPEGGDNDDELDSFVCESCGGEIICEPTTAATSCPFCGNPVVLAGRVSGGLRPDLIIPFELDKKAAVEAYNRHLSGKPLLPKVFKGESRLKEIKGIYVPFWLFDAKAHVDLRYRATKVNIHSDSHNTYTDTYYYSVRREGDIEFSSVPSDASVKMPDKLMDSVEPFDYSRSVDFRGAYLAGYAADKYDVTAEDSAERVSARIKKSAESAFASTVTDFSSVTAESGSVKIDNGKVRYALLPVWFMKTVWRGNEYTFAMNGQTGKFVGDLPIDGGAALRWFCGVAAAAAAAAYGLLCLIFMR